MTQLSELENLYKNLEVEHNKTIGLTKTLTDKNTKLESELRDARDSAELLEFRLLELEQRESREKSPGVVRKMSDAGHDGDSGCSGSLVSLEDVLDNQADFRVSDPILIKQIILIPSYFEELN